MRTRPLAAGAGLLAVLALAACHHGSSRAGGPRPAKSSTPAVSAPGRLRWRPCSGGQNMRCASLKVPLNYAKPSGRRISIALSEVPATAPASKRLGILLVNPGGPGASGLTLASFVAQGLKASVAARYDIIGFDTRGVGASVPSLHCEPTFFAHERPAYVPRNHAAEKVLIGRARTYAADCEKKYGWLLPYMTTANIARDMDQIRAAMHQPKLSYFGYSYGTYIGQVYATLFPRRVHRMVLDSTVDPTGVWWKDNIEQDYAFQGRMNAFLAWAAGYGHLYHLGTTAAQVRQTWQHALAKLTAHPVAESSGPAIGPAEFTDTFVAGGYNNEYWPLLASALSDYLRGSGSQLASLYQQIGKTPENEFAVYNAVECADVAWPRSWSYWNSVNRKVYRSAPLETWDNVWFNAACAFWPVHGPAKPMRIGASGLPGILMLQGSLDAATPYAGAMKAHEALPTSKMVVVEGGGNHGQSLAYPPNTCVNGYLNRYLATGWLPAKPGLVNAICLSLPPPSPG